MFRLLCEKAEVQNITVHGLRHTHATFLIEAEQTLSTFQLG